MDRLRRLAFAVLCLLSSTASAAEKPTMETARQIATKAVELVDSVGVDSARPTFHSEGEFRFGEIYVCVISTDGTWLVYPPNPKFEGRSVLNVRDEDGKLLVREIISVATDRGEGWVRAYPVKAHTHYI